MELIKHITAIVEKYKKANELLDNIMTEATKYDTYIENFKTDKNKFFGISWQVHNDINNKKIENKRNFICEILQYEELQNFMTHKQREKMSKDLYKLGEAKEFEINDATAHELLDSLFKNADDLIIDALKEVFNLLINNYKNWQETYKSIDTFKVGKKSIIKCCGDIFSAKSYLVDIETAFNLCTGRRERDNLDVAYTAFNRNYKGNYRYFDVKYCKNGNIHIIFTDTDAVEKLNCKIGKYFNQLQNVA